MAKVQHLQIYKPGFSGGVVNTTLCGRVRNGGADLNCTDKIEEVTCHFCKRDIEKKSARFVKWHDWKPQS